MAARSGEVLGARWEEIDFQTKVWTVPPERMKGGREHRVPLSERALIILVELHEARMSEFVFPGLKRGRPLNNAAFEDGFTARRSTSQRTAFAPHFGTGLVIRRRSPAMSSRLR